ncbi:hypothetical protein GA0070615_4297 [Micromonospora aurantiaca]|nr:hypothetical protein GA0070615_4297 [Micromonospora aurantiaca]
MKATRADVQRAMNARVTDWIDQAEVEYEPRPATASYSVKLSPDDLAWLFEEAERRDVSPSTVMQELVSQARQAAGSAPADHEAGDEPQA